MDGGSTDVVVRATAGDHAVQIYRADDELADLVATYAVSGFEVGEPALLVATVPHIALFRDAISRHGWPADEAEGDGLLMFANAGAILRAIVDDREVSASRFEHVVGALVDSLAAQNDGGTVRAYGEMVDLLCQRDDPQRALALEELWSDLARTRRFSLLCSYRLDVFDREAQVSPLPSVCQAHSHVLPVPDVERLTAAVDGALEDVLGSEQSRKVYALIGNDARRRRIPVAQLALMWISRNMPLLASRVLAVARERYESGAVAA